MRSSFLSASPSVFEPFHRLLFDDGDVASQFALELNIETASTQQWANDKNLLPTCCRAANEILCNIYHWSACTHKECIVLDVLTHSVLVTCLTIASCHEQQTDLTQSLLFVSFACIAFYSGRFFVAAKDANLHIPMLFFTWEKPTSGDHCGRPGGSEWETKKRENIKHDLCFSCSASSTST